jgi:hypothetical protein
LSAISTYGWILGPLVGLASFVAAWLRGRGQRADQTRLREELTAARAELREMPKQILEALAPALPRAEGADEVESGMTPEDFVAYVGYVDVTNDGEPELLVLHPAGVHASLLKVFGTQDVYSGFELLDELHSGVAGGFEVGDFDGDGLSEIATVNADFDRGPDRSYANAILVENLHRWNGFGFEHVGEGEVYDPESGAPVPPRLQQLLGKPSWALG